MKAGDLVARGREILTIEQEALDRVVARLDDRFSRAIRLLKRASGKVIVTGVGKSGIIAQKMAATLNSTGTSAVYLHPVDAMHGDLGMARRDDAIVIFSKSGDTPELARLLPAISGLGLSIVAITGNPESLLAKKASVVLDASVEREACAFDLAPTASTTAMIALADALSIVLYEVKGFTESDFALTHPGGTIGRRLLLKVGDLMKTGDNIPVVDGSAPFRKVIVEMSRKRLGCVLIANSGKQLEGIITDGDLRRLLERHDDVMRLDAASMMTPDPMTALPDVLGSTALVMMEEKKRTHLPVVDRRGRLQGIVHMHDLVEAGLKG